MPGWREPIFPPYFVVGAMYSGFAMVVLLAAAISRGLGLQALITERHFEAMAKIMLMSAIVMGLSYSSEWFAAWIGGNPSDRSLVAFEFTGAYCAGVRGRCCSATCSRRRSCGFLALENVSPCSSPSRSGFSSACGSSAS